MIHKDSCPPIYDTVFIGKILPNYIFLKPKMQTFKVSTAHFIRDVPLRCGSIKYRTCIICQKGIFKTTEFVCLNVVVI
jgi:hypothetical protein